MKGMASAPNPTTTATKGRPTFRLTAAKRRTLDLLAEFFCLRVYDAENLLRSREPNESDLRTARCTLRLLWQEGLAHREFYVEPDRSYQGVVSYVYGLSDKGIKLGFDWSLPKTFDEHSARTLD